ncbi:MAG: hypothetical protein Q7S29_05040 [Candidatus Peribacter sp.]|nr:hypothetical protein [Candidatus Peribacter sp.]
MLHSPRSPLCQTEEKILSAVGDEGLSRAQTLCGEHFSLEDLQHMHARLENGADRDTLSTMIGIIHAEQTAVLELFLLKKRLRKGSQEIG